MNEWGLYEEIKPIDGDIIVSRALPGFQFRISDLYRMPPLSELVKDEVYQGYVMVKYQAEKAEKERQRARAERERLRAERERLRAERERQRAEREKAEKERERERAQREKAEKERERKRAEEAEQKAEEADKKAQQAKKELERLMALLQAQGISLDEGANHV